MRILQINSPICVTRKGYANLIVTQQDSKMFENFKNKFKLLLRTSPEIVPQQEKLTCFVRRDSTLQHKGENYKLVGKPPMDTAPYIFGVSPRISVNFEAKTESHQLTIERNEVDALYERTCIEFWNKFTCLAPDYEEIFHRNLYLLEFEQDSVYKRAMQAMCSEGYHVSLGTWTDIVGRPQVLLFGMRTARKLVRSSNFVELRIRQRLQDEPPFDQEMSDACLFRFQISRFIYHFNREIDKLANGKTPQRACLFTLGEENCWNFQNSSDVEHQWELEDDFVMPSRKPGVSSAIPIPCGYASC